MPLELRLPPDLDSRLATLGEATAAACPEVLFAYLFGSVASETRTPRSDVDLAVFVDPAADAHGVRMAVARTASRHLRTDAVDVVLLNTAPIALAGRVLTSRRVLLDRDPFARHRFESLTARQFQDFRIREHRILAERAAHG
jgi:predicted nucleotidyltransferase